MFLSVSALTPGSNLLQFYHVFPVMNELQIPWLSANKMWRQLHCNLEVKLLEGSLLQRMVLQAISLLKTHMKINIYFSLFPVKIGKSEFLVLFKKMCLDFFQKKILLIKLQSETFCSVEIAEVYIHKYALWYTLTTWHHFMNHEVLFYV